MKHIIKRTLLASLVLLHSGVTLEAKALIFTNATDYENVLVPYQTRLAYQTKDPSKIIAKIPRGSLAAAVNYPQGVSSFAVYVPNPSTKQYQLVVKQGGSGSRVVFHPAQIQSGTFKLADGSKEYAHKLHGPVNHIFREVGVQKWK